MEQRKIIEDGKVNDKDHGGKLGHKKWQLTNNKNK